MARMKCTLTRGKLNGSVALNISLNITYTNHNNIWEFINHFLDCAPVSDDPSWACSAEISL